MNKYTYTDESLGNCYDFANYTEAPGCPGGVPVSLNHPSIDQALKDGVTFPRGHVVVDSMLRSWLPTSHPNVDDLLQQGTPLPDGHPDIDPYLCPNASVHNYSLPAGCPVTVLSNHPSVDASIARGGKVPYGHPEVDILLRPWMPKDHPNIDDLLQAGTALPDGHPSIDAYICDGGSCSLVPYKHPSVDESIKDGQQLPFGHPLVDDILRPFLPDGHPNCDDMIKSRTPLPEGHPSVDQYLCEESVFTAGVIMTCIVGCFLALAVALRLGLVLLDFGSAVKIFAPPNHTALTAVSKGEVELEYKSNQNRNAQRVSDEVCAVAVNELESADTGPSSDYAATIRPDSGQLPHRSLAIHDMEQLHAQHKSLEKIYPESKYEGLPLPTENGPILAININPEEYSNSYMMRMYHIIGSYRVPFVDLPGSTVYVFFLYFILNALCVAFAPHTDYGKLSWRT